MLYSFTTTVPIGSHRFVQGKCTTCKIDSSRWGGEWCHKEFAVVNITSDTALGLLLSKPREARIWLDDVYPEVKEALKNGIEEAAFALAMMFKGID